MTNAEEGCNKSLRPRKPEGSLEQTAQDVHLDSHTAPELWSVSCVSVILFIAMVLPLASCQLHFSFTEVVLPLAACQLRY